MEPYFFINSFNDSRLIEALAKHRKTLVVCDQKVAKLYGDFLVQTLSQHIQIKLITHLEGEHNKTRKSKARLEDQWAELNLNKSDAILALGGGLTLDLAGFTAATYLRGIPTYYVPTTLVACVDACMGGKVAINTPFGKNTLGTFYSARALFIPTFTLQTLSRKDLSCGYMEAIKTFAIHSSAPAMSSQLWPEDSFKDLIDKCLHIKSYFVSKDPYDQHCRKILNFGHSVGHAIEKASSYCIDHGWAVGYGMIIEASILASLKHCDPTLPLLLKHFTKLYQLPKDINLPSAQELMEFCLRDKKNSEHIELVYLKSWGKPDLKNPTYPLSHQEFYQQLNLALIDLKEHYANCNIA